MKAPKVFLKRKTKDMRINLLNGGILCAWKANLDIQIVLEPYGCASYIVGYISKSQRGMSAQLDVPEKVNDKNDDDQDNSSSSNESGDNLDDDNSQGSDLLYKTKKWNEI